MKIEIEFTAEGKCRNSWTVRYGDRYADGLCYEEMLGLVASITMPESFKDRNALNWLKTEQGHKDWQERLENAKVIVKQIPSNND
jgi:hypothetical protein